MTKRFLLLLIAIALSGGPVSADPEQPSESAEPADAAKAIAVLDFRDLGPSVELEPLRRALARMLTTDLSAYRQVKVVARERVYRMITETHLGDSGLVGADSAQRAGRALAADYLVQATFAGSAAGIRVQAEVFDVAAGRVIATAEVSGQPEGLLAMEGKLLAAVAGTLKLEAPGAAPAPQPGAKPVSLAVLYLQNLSADATLDPMEVGFTDMLSTYLQDRKGLALVEREQLHRVLQELGLQQSALAESAPQPKLGQLLGAQVMLLGSFVVVGDSIRFDAHLVAADTGVMLHAVSAQGSVGDLQPVLETLADRAATALAAQPRSEPRPERRGKTSVEAMLHYSRGVALMYSDDRRALEEFERCLYLDPDVRVNRP
jgi:TolB-like protein